MTDGADEPAPAPKATGRPSRWLAIALVISVALNLFALGLVAARAMRPGPHERARGYGPFMGPHGLLQDGDGAEPIAKRVMQRYGEDLRREHRELREARRAVREALEAEPLDAGRLERALGELRARTDSSQTRMHAALVELARSLPLEQRKKLARRAHVLESARAPARTVRTRGLDAGRGRARRAKTPPRRL